MTFVQRYMENDKPSSTAIFVANGVWWVSMQRKLGPIVTEAMTQANRLMVESLNQGLFSPTFPMGSLLLRARTRMLQMLSIPGFYLHFVCRKRCIENLVREAIRDGAEQVVVVGAGFDTLSLRVATGFPTLPIIEIDHPATQAWKCKAIPNQAWAQSNLHFLPLDLSMGTLSDTLVGSAHYLPDRPTVFVVEGLLMYLQESEVKDLLGCIKAHSGPFSRIVFTFMEEQSPGVYQFPGATWFVNLWLKIKKEKFTWGLPNPQMPDFLAKSGLTLLTIKNHRDLRQEFLGSLSPKTALARGENIGVASTGRSKIDFEGQA